MITLTLPGLPPSVNRRYSRRAGGVQVALAPETAAWQAGAALAIRAAAGAAMWHVPPQTPLCVALALSTPRLYGGDLDNTLKAAGDAIATALDVDDRYIVAWHVTKARGPATTTLTIQEARP